MPFRLRQLRPVEYQFEYDMPLSLHQTVAPAGEIGIWDIEEPEEWFLGRLLLSPEEQQQFHKLKGRRRTEWLAARQLVHEMSGRLERAAFVKDAFGKPFLRESNYHISISHSQYKAAAIAAPRAVGIDIQHWVPRIERLASRFLSREELSNLAPGPEERLFQIHVLWSGKEALYKAYGKKALDFCQHLSIQPLPAGARFGQVRGQILKGAQVRDFQLVFWEQGAYVVAYAIAAGEG